MPESLHPEALFNELLEADRDRWSLSIPPLLERLAEERCLYGGRAMVKVLRPKFLSRGLYAYLGYISGVVMGALRRLEERALHDPVLLDFLGVGPKERELLLIPPLCPQSCAVARLDTFLAADGPKIVELNGEAPAGPGFCDATARVFEEHPLVQEVLSRSGAFAPSALRGLREGLLLAWRAAGCSGRPRILITDYLDVPTSLEFEIIADDLRRHGLETVVEDPRRLTYQEGHLVAQGQKVDLVYRRVLTNEFLACLPEVQPLLQAYRDQAVVMVDPFRAKLTHKKTAFAVLTGDGLEEPWLTREEQRVVRQHVPWTRRVRDARTTFRGREVDLLPFLLEHREDFVLKPADDYGGRGVLPGWEASRASFEEQLLEGERLAMVAQERVRPQREFFPAFDQGLQQVSYTVDLDPYVYMGRVAGVLARLSAGALCNVTSGGGQTPVFIHPDP